MKFNGYFRFIAAFMVLSLLVNVWYPTISYALSFNITQPEYTSYGNKGSQEMVNPQTGDFSLTLPVLEIPGTEASFSLPLTYHGGIMTDQEASWVGLGWNMNVGAILRTPSSTPDDYNGSPVTTSIESEGITGSSITFMIPMLTYNFGSMGNKMFSGGYHYAPMLYNIGFGDNSGTGSILDFINYSPKSGGGTCLSIDPVGLGMFVVTVVLVVATWGAYGFAAAAISVAKQAAISLAIQITATWIASSLAKSYSGMQSTQARGMYVPVSNSNDCKNYVVIKECDIQNGKIDFSKLMLSYGSLYLQNQNVEDIGARGSVKRTNGSNVPAYSDYVAGDAYRYVDKDDFTAVTTPYSLAYDKFNVMGDGVGGVIEPYRLETGSSATEFIMKNTSHKRMAIGNFNAGYKVPFRYAGALSNGYKHHYGKRADGSDIKYEDVNPTGIDISRNRVADTSFAMVIKDEDLHLYQQKEEADRNGLYSQTYDSKAFRFLAQGKHVQWYSNEEVQYMSDPNSHSGGKNYLLDAGFVDWLPGTNSNGNYSATSRRNLFRAALPSKGIGAFSITREDGTTYHYTLPVYNRKIKSIATTITNVPELNNTKVYTDNTSEMPDDFAVSWLLTAITGPDFVDRGERGYLDELDWGQWTKFEYGKFANDYTWRTPYSGKTNSLDRTVAQYSIGVCQTYYLNAIINRSHVALFEKSYRTDAHAATENAESAQPSSALKLDNIYVMDYVSYKKLLLKGLSTVKGDNSSLANGDSYSFVYDKSDFDELRSDLDKSAVQKISFRYDYSLCQGVSNSYLSPNSLSRPAAGENGKLTLKSISVLGKDNSRYAGDYKFSYANNPAYDTYKQDGWGFYCQTGTSNPSSHLPTNVNDAAAWSLTKMDMPRGASMEVEYTADTYNEICGKPVSYYYPGETERIGGGLRVKKIRVTDKINGTVSDVVYQYQDGVAATEPEEINQHFYNRYTADLNNPVKLDYERFKHFYDFPFTPVLYKKVIAQSGAVADYLSTVEYNFTTPDMDKMFELRTRPVQDSSIIRKVRRLPAAEKSAMPQMIPTRNTNDTLVNRRFKSLYTEIIDKTAYIGQMTSMIKKNKNGDLEEEVIYNYVNSWPDGRGEYTEGLVQSDLVSSGSTNYLLMQKTIKKSVPVYIASVTSKDHRYGFERTVTLNDLDFITGVPTSTSSMDSYGNTILNKIEHAYKHYAGMGPKAQNITNRNMLSQQTGSYVYKYPGTDVSKKVLVSANVTTWSKDVDVYDFLQASPLSQETKDHNNVWRLHGNYVFSGSPTDVLDKNGNYPLAAFKPFNYGNVAGNELNGWQKTGEMVMYDPYSHFLSSKDLSGQFSSSKLDTLHRLPLVSGNRCKIGEIAYSGAEYYYGNRSSDGGVLRMDGYASTQFKHTGRYSLQVQKGKEGFRYTIPGTELKPDRKYRASVWVYLPGTSERDLSSFELGYTINNQQKKIAPGKPSNKAASWYLFNLDIIPDGNNDIVVSCKNKAYRDIYLDDFRVHPLDAPVNSYVYDPESFSVVAKLDGDNMYSRIEYDKTGKPIRFFEERFGVAEKLVLQKSYLIK